MADLQYLTGEEPRINDRVRLVDVNELKTQMDQPAERGEYVVDDLSWGMLLLVSETAAIWCVPQRCVKITAPEQPAARR